MDYERDLLMQKVRFIMESPTERMRYKELDTFKDKLQFIKNHFVMSDMAIRLLERQYLLSPGKKDELMMKVDSIIEGLER